MWLVFLTALCVVHLYEANRRRCPINAFLAGLLASCIALELLIP